MKVRITKSTAENAKSKAVSAPSIQGNRIEVFENGPWTSLKLESFVDFSREEWSGFILQNLKFLSREDREKAKKVLEGAA